MAQHDRHPSLSLLDKPFAIMGIVNVTPDSFYDGGRYAAADAAYRRGMRLVEEGADVIDIGGESTRPGAVAVSAAEECARVIPVIERLARDVTVPLSIDTTKSDVAGRAFQAGASWINDISAGRFDRGMTGFAAKQQCPVVLMHSRETPENMQESPAYDDVVAEVEAELMHAVGLFTAGGVRRANILLDPGIGFAKRLEDNLKLLGSLDRLAKLGFCLLVGTSRKSFIGKLTGKEPQGRLAGSLGSVAAAYVGGAKVFRVHDVGETRDMLSVLSAIIGNRPGRP